jgi:uncharacterized protein YcgI (DUF1989 family)
MRQVLIKGGYGGRIDVAEGEILEIFNVEGQQICDFFAFNASDPTEFLSPLTSGPSCAASCSRSATCW